MIPAQWVAGRGLQGRLAGRRLRPFTEKFLLEPKIERPSFNFGLLRFVCLICRNCLDRLTHAWIRARRHLPWWFEMWSNE
jgi:hypothetical protein